MRVAIPLRKAGISSVVIFSVSTIWKLVAIPLRKAGISRKLGLLLKALGIIDKFELQSRLEKQAFQVVYVEYDLYLKDLIKTIEILLIILDNNIKLKISCNPA